MSFSPRAIPTTARAPYWDLCKPVCSTFHALDCRSLFKCLIILISTADEQVFGEFWQGLFVSTGSDFTSVYTNVWGHALESRSLPKCYIILMNTADEQVFGEFWQNPFLPILILPWIVQIIVCGSLRSSFLYCVELVLLRISLYFRCAPCPDLTVRRRCRAASCVSILTRFQLADSQWLFRAF